jgi:hypothetical protein
MNQAEVISMSDQLHGEPHDQNILEKAASRLMGGSTEGGDQQPQIVIGQEYGRTPYSDEPLKLYESTRNNRTTLDAGEYYAISQGYLREWVCMGQCNLYIQALKNPKLRQSMETYRHDVCEPNLTELKVLLERVTMHFLRPTTPCTMRKARSLLAVWILTRSTTA